MVLQQSSSGGLERQEVYSVNDGLWQCCKLNIWQYTFKFSILDIFIVSGCFFITIAQLSYDYVSSILIDWNKL